MRIISNFSDYYDSVQAYGMDNKVIYKRKTNEFSVNTNEYDDLKNNEIIKKLIPADSYGRSYLYFNDQKGLNLDHFYLIFFCAEVIPCFVFTYKFLEEGYNEETYYYWCYCLEDILDLVVLKGSKKQKKCWLGKKKQQSFIYYGNNEKRIPMILKNTQLYQKDKAVYDLHYKLGVPVFCYSEYCKGSEFIINPQLKKMKFYKTKDVYQTFQDISMFVSGVLGGQSPPMIEISDKVRKAKHGFDKWSFRKHKEER